MQKLSLRLEIYKTLTCREMEKKKDIFFDKNRCKNCPAYIDDSMYTDSGCKITDIIKMVDDDIEHSGGGKDL